MRQILALFLISTLLLGCLPKPGKLDTSVLDVNGAKAEDADGTESVTFSLSVELTDVQARRLSDAAICVSAPTKSLPAGTNCKFGDVTLAYGTFQDYAGLQKVISSIDNGAIDVKRTAISTYLKTTQTPTKKEKTAWQGIPSSQIKENLLSVTGLTTTKNLQDNFKTSLTKYTAADGTKTVGLKKGAQLTTPDGLAGNASAIHGLWRRKGRVSIGFAQEAKAGVAQDSTVLVTPLGELPGGVPRQTDSNGSSVQIVNLRKQYEMDVNPTDPNSYQVGVGSFLGQWANPTSYQTFQTNLAPKNSTAFISNCQRAPYANKIKAQDTNLFSSDNCNSNTDGFALSGMNEADLDVQSVAGADQGAIPVVYQAADLFGTLADLVSPQQPTDKPTVDNRQFITMNFLGFMLGLEGVEEKGNGSHPRQFSISYGGPEMAPFQASAPALGCPDTVGGAPFGQDPECANRTTLKNLFNQINVLNIMGFSFFVSSGDVGITSQVINNPIAAYPNPPAAWSDYPNFSAGLGQDNALKNQRTLAVLSYPASDRSAGPAFGCTLPMLGKVSWSVCEQILYPYNKAGSGFDPDSMDNSGKPTCGCLSLLNGNPVSLTPTAGEAGNANTLFESSITFGTSSKPAFPVNTFAYPLDAMKTGIRYDAQKSVDACPLVVAEDPKLYCSFVAFDTLKPVMPADVKSFKDMSNFGSIFTQSQNFPWWAENLMTVNMPGNLPNVTTIGGTMMATKWKTGHEYTEHAATLQNGAGFTTGGGFSRYIDGSIFKNAYAYQKAASSDYLGKNWYNDTVKADGTLVESPKIQAFSPTARVVPDLAANAHQFVINTTDAENPGWNPWGGTSAAAPLITTMVARAAYELDMAFGNFNWLLYRIYDDKCPGTDCPFEDITSDAVGPDGKKAPVGNHCGEEYCLKNGLYVTPGYDAVTGVGTPRYTKLKAAIKEVVCAEAAYKGKGACKS